MGITLSNTKYKYDVDPAENYREIEKRVQPIYWDSKNAITKKFFLTVIIIDPLLICCHLLGISFEDAMNSSKGFITVNYGYPDYFLHLGQFLSIADPLKIKAILNHQKKVSKVKITGKFEKAVQHGVYAVINSMPFDTTAVREKVMEWVYENEQKPIVGNSTKTAKKAKAITAKKYVVNWNGINLTKISRFLYKQKCFSKPTDFEKIFKEQQKTNWLKDIDYLAYLLFRLHSVKVNGKSLISAQVNGKNTKSYLIAFCFFVSDNRGQIFKNRSLSDRSNKIHKNPGKYPRVLAFVEDAIKRIEQ